MRPMSKNKSKTMQIVDARFAIDGDVIDFFKPDFTVFEAVIDGLGRQTRPVLDPSKAFFLCSGDKFAINKQAGGGIAVISVETEDFHQKRSAITGHRSAETNQQQCRHVTFFNVNLASCKSIPPKNLTSTRKPMFWRWRSSS